MPSPRLGFIRAILVLGPLLALGACSGTAGGSGGGASSAGSGAAPPASSAAQPSGTQGGRTVYAALGASETYGVGANPITDGYAYRLRAALHLGAGQFADVGVPGATLADAYQIELTNALAITPTVSTVFFGANDIRAGVPLSQFSSDLSDLVSTLRRAHSQVLIVGLPDLGQVPALRSVAGLDLGATTQAWNQAMQTVATTTGADFLSLAPFTGEIAAHPEDIAADGLHPSNAGHQRLADIILSALQSRGWVSS